MRVSRRHGRLRLRLDDVEVELMSGLLVELIALVEQSEADDPVTRRLFPSAYPDDGEADADFRSITESSLRSDRLERISACEAELAHGGDVELGDEDTARRWIQVLNDLRLSLGTRLGVSEDQQDPPSGDPVDPANQPWLVYYWLTAVQDSVVTSLMR